MSRVGRMPIPVPNGVTVDIDGKTVSVKGSKGSLSQTITGNIVVTLEEGQVVVSRSSEDKKTKGFHGLYRQLIHNMVVGVSQGFSRSLLINGVGYRAEVGPKTVTLNLGYSNPVDFAIPDGITVVAEGANKLIVSGIDKQLVGKTASEIRSVRPPEPYKGKGVKYEEEHIRRKVGKSGIK